MFRCRTEGTERVAGAALFASNEGRVFAAGFGSRVLNIVKIRGRHMPPRPPPRLVPRGRHRRAFPSPQTCPRRTAPRNLPTAAPPSRNAQHLSPSPLYPSPRPLCPSSRRSPGPTPAESPVPSFPRKREPSNFSRLPTVHARHRLWAPAFAGETIEEYRQFDCSRFRGHDEKETDANTGLTLRRPAGPSRLGHPPVSACSVLHRTGAEEEFCPSNQILRSGPA
jgi:hypothetical protein